MGQDGLQAGSTHRGAAIRGLPGELAGAPGV